MGKAAKSSGIRGDQPPKAGKKSTYKAPPAINKDKQDARLEGMRQFTAKKFPQPLPSQKGTWEEAMDILCAHFHVKRIRRQQSHDTGIRYDPTRKHLIYPPNHKEEV